MDDYKGKYINLIKAYLSDREGSKDYLSEGIRRLSEELRDFSDEFELAVMRNSRRPELPSGRGPQLSDPVFTSVLDLETIRQQIGEEMEIREDLINCFALILVLYRRIDTAYLLLDIPTRKVLSRVYFDKVKTYALKKEFCYGQKRIDQMVREGIEYIYEAVASPVYDHAVSRVQRS